MKTSFDIIIMGAGMVGATIASGLAHSGMRIAVIDPHCPANIVGDETPRLRVSAISFASEQVLRHVGAWSHLNTERLCPYRRLAVNELPARAGLAASLPDISKWARTEFRASDIAKPYLGHIVENDAIQLALHEQLSGLDAVELCCPAKVEQLSLRGRQKQVRLEGGEVLEARLVIGADGARSQLREAANIGQFREQYEQHAFVCTVSYRGEQQDITWQSFTPEGPLAFLPLADQGEQHFASLVWYDAKEQTDALLKMDDATLLRALQQRFPSELPRLNAVQGRGRFPLFKSHAKHYAADGVVLAGDAAHTINPLAGQGVNLGFLDAAVLIEVLAQAHMNSEDIGDVSVLRRYEKRRRFDNQAMMSAMDMFYYGFNSQHLPLRVFRNLGLGLANHSGVAKNRVLEYAIGMRGKVPRLARPA